MIGVFGEWGAGKSHLLKLMYDESKRFAKECVGWRKTDAGFGLTVPVVFQPWKYEHEAHLHVPLVLHIFSALKKQLNDGATGWEKFVKDASTVGDKVVNFMPNVVKLFEKCFTATVAATDGMVAAGAVKHFSNSFTTLGIKLTTLSPTTDASLTNFSQPVAPSFNCFLRAL